MFLNSDYELKHVNCNKKIELEWLQTHQELRQWSKVFKKLRKTDFYLKFLTQSCYQLSGGQQKSLFQISTIQKYSSHEPPCLRKLLRMYFIKMRCLPKKEYILQENRSFNQRTRQMAFPRWRESQDDRYAPATRATLSKLEGQDSKGGFVRGCHHSALRRCTFFGFVLINVMKLLENIFSQSKRPC